MGHRSRQFAVLAGTAGALFGVATAQAADTVTATASQAKACHTTLRPDAASTDTFQRTAPADGLVRVRMTGGRGDWDIGVFDASGRSVAGSAAARSNELAEGFVRQGQQLTVQACRFAGGGGTGELDVSFVDLSASQAKRAGETAQLVSVKADLVGRNRLNELGLDVSEHAHDGWTDVVTYTQAERDLLQASGFTYRVEVADLAAQHRASRQTILRAERREARGVASAAQQYNGGRLPSGRTSYRRLADYETEMKTLALQQPKLVKLVTLSEQTLEGRDIMGVEIARNPQAEDGRPVFFNMGAHHAREWPSSEHVMEFAYDLLRQYRSNPRGRFLVNATRTLSVPIVNPDGFNVSREAARVAPDLAFSEVDLEMRRKNCRVAPGVPSTEDCSLLARNIGVDLNRNYGQFWGGQGASPNPLSDTYRGEAPFSEPEVQAVSNVLRTRNVTNLITNHTYGALALRPPGVAAVGLPTDEPLLRELGSRLTQHNGYANIPAFGLYDTSGTTDDYSFWTMGAMSYTFEIGLLGFHPDDFQTGVVAEYLGGQQSATAAGRGGNRMAYSKMLAATYDREFHSQVVGSAPRGSTLRLSKQFTTTTSPVIQPGGSTTDPIEIPDFIDIEMRTDRPTFVWDVNPSTRPIAAGRFGREPTGEGATPTITLTNPAGNPPENPTYPLPRDADVTQFTIPDTGDNGQATVHVEWTNPDNDWDLYVYDESGSQVASSASFGDIDEDAVLLFPDPGTYTVEVVNWDQVDGPFDDWTGEVRFEEPTPPVAGTTESYTLTCERPDGRPTEAREVVVERGERISVGRVCEPVATR